MDTILDDTADGPDSDLLPAEHDRKKRSVTRQALEWAILIGSALVIALLIKTFLFQAFYIPSESMLPTLRTEDRVLVNKVSYRVHDVNRGDIVVFTAPEGRGPDGIEDLVKRVIGLPGETVEGHDGHVFVDGRRLEEPYLDDGQLTSDFDSIEVPAGTIWVMGDNRDHSQDSRVFGPIPQSDIVGRVFVRIWPLGRLGFL